jgi:hypothetical protein
MSQTAQASRVNNITLEDINGMVVDTVNKSSEVMKRVVSRPDRWNGRDYRVNIFTNNSTLGQSFKTTEVFDTTIDYNTTQMIFYPTGYAQPVGVSVVERSINATPAGVVDLYQSSYQYAQNSMITNLATIFYGYGLGNDFDGYGVIVDDGTNTSSYGGVTRSTNTSINSYLLSATGGVLDLASMASVDDGSTISGDVSETSNVVLQTQAVWSLYESLLTPTTRAEYQVLGGNFINGASGVEQNVDMGNGLSLKSGATSLMWRGKWMVRDQKCPTGDMFMTNENWFWFRSLPLKGLNIVATTESATTGAYDEYKVSAFQFRDYMMPYNQLSEVGIFVMYGQFGCKNPNRNGLLYSITTT